jgi:hypothetical protein
MFSSNSAHPFTLQILVLQTVMVVQDSARGDKLTIALPTALAALGAIIGAGVSWTSITNAIVHHLYEVLHCCDC